MLQRSVSKVASPPLIGHTNRAESFEIHDAQRVKEARLKIFR